MGATNSNKGITVGAVREYLKDYPFANYKYDDEIFSDDDIVIAVKWAIKRVDSVPPFDARKSTEFSEYTMLIGTIAQLFKRLVLNRTVNYDPGIVENGINVPLGEELQVFKEIADEYDTSFMQSIKLEKQAKNVEDSYTSINSPYNRYGNKF